MSLNHPNQRNPRRAGAPHLAIALALSGLAMPAVIAATDLRQMIEAEWLDEAAGRAAVAPTPQSDAAGGCDGIKDGTWGFHTQETKNPWWQVDLGATRAIARVVIWNRCAAVASRNAHLQIHVSDDGQNWRQVFANDGRVFLGFTDGKPLEARLDAVSGRHVRIQLPGKDFLHLDEVEIFGPEAPATNLALRQPATQSSVSEWSRAHPQPLPPERQAERLSQRRAQRKQAMAHPLLDFDDLLFHKRVTGPLNPNSAQYHV